MTEPDLIASWPGIGNIGLVAVDTLRRALRAEHFADIEPWDFFYPHTVSIESDVLKDLAFPRCRFFSAKVGHRDVIFFVGEEQPDGQRKNYEMADLILDMAALMNCRRIYTAAAAVTAIHHTACPRVWVVPNSEDLKDELKRYPNTILMSQLEGGASEGNITGMNGLLLGVAKKRGFKGACLLGEIPVYVSQYLTPYPKASRSIVEVFCHMLDTEIDLTSLDEMVSEVDQNIDKFYSMIPQEMRERIDQLKAIEERTKEKHEGITEEDKRNIMQNIEEFFKKGGRED